MKNFFLLITFFLSTTSSATHNRAGEITYEQIGALTYQITVTTYTKASSVPADRDSLEVFWGDGTSEYVQRSNGNGILLGNDIKENHYISTHTYSSIGAYTVSMTDPNRNAGILNLNPPNSDQIPFYLEAEIVILPTGTNNSPIFLNKPVDMGYIGQKFSHCPNHIDTEGDSLVYELVTPKQGINSLALNYSLPHLIGSQPQVYSFDAMTGMYTWLTPQIAGEYVITIRLKEYRNGVFIGSILRDMQITIAAISNRPPDFSDTSNVVYEIKPGQSLQFMISAEDSDNDSIRLAATGFPLQKNATFSASNNFMISTSGIFSWTPSVADVRNQPYQMVFRVEDNRGGTFGAVAYKVVRIKVDFPVSTKSIKQETITNFKLFPNPVSNHLTIDFEKPILENTSLSIFKNTGELVKITAINQSQQTVEFDVSDLSSGNYFFIFNENGTMKKTQFLIVR
ncbi:MAG: T9SS type A sorting domain-containing protein [Saprospiraceae bacterium]